MLTQCLFMPLWMQWFENLNLLKRIFVLLLLSVCLSSPIRRASFMCVRYLETAVLMLTGGVVSRRRRRLGGDTFQIWRS